MKNLIIRCGMPISVVSNPYFRQFCKDMDSKDDPPCRQTVTNVLIPRVVDDAKAHLKDKLQGCSSEAVTTDIWTDRRCHSYIAVTIHTLVDGIPSSDLLAVKAVHGSHSGQLINDQLEQLIAEFDIKSKTRYVVTDNASHMIKAMCLFFPSIDADAEDLQFHVDDTDLWGDLPVDDLEAAFNNAGSRIACFCHSLQLVICSGLEKAQGSRSALSKVTKLANLVHQSCLFRTAFETKFPGKHLIPTANDTHWNSLYRQVEAVVLLDGGKMSELLHETSHENLIMTAKEHSQIVELVQVPGPFAQATDATQSDSMITISLVVSTVLVLTKKLNEMRPVMRSHIGLVDELLNQMHERFYDIYETLSIEHLQA